MATQPTVLIAEDERDLADLFTQWLATDYSVRTAYDGQQALHQLDQAVDCVLLDRRMPNLSGDEVLQVIRERGMDCSVAMVTAVEPDFDIIEMGFDDYVVKPISKGDLHSLVEGMLSLDSYDDLMQRYFQLASKKAALEETKSSAALANSDEYAALIEEFERVQAQADQQIEGLANQDDSSGIW